MEDSEGDVAEGPGGRLAGASVKPPDAAEGAAAAGCCCDAVPAVGPGALLLGFLPRAFDACLAAGD